VIILHSGEWIVTVSSNQAIRIYAAAGVAMSHQMRG
jgi:hypothetical protein